VELHRSHARQLIVLTVALALVGLVFSLAASLASAFNDPPQLNTLSAAEDYQDRQRWFSMLGNWGDHAVEAALPLALVSFVVWHATAIPESAPAPSSSPAAPDARTARKA
jgi:hypothetical protein